MKTACEFCGGADVAPLNAYGPRCLAGDYKIVAGQVENVWCRRCGLGWNRLMMADDELAAFYAGYTKKVASADEDDLLYGGPEVETLTDSQARFLADHVPAASGRILDIGCGKGSFLRAFRSRRPGWDLVGIEPSREEAAIARRDGTTTVYEGMFGSVPLEAASFDLITIMHVLEHVSRPAEVVRQMRAALKPGGLLFIEVPNTLDLNMFYDLLLFEHLYHFSPDTLTWFLRSEGFEIAAIEPSTSYGAQRIVARKTTGAPMSAQALPVVRMAGGFAAWSELWRSMTRLADAGAARSAAGGRVALFGAGMTAATWLVYTALHDATLVGCFDESPFKIGHTLLGQPVHALADIAGYQLDAVLIATMPNSQRLVAGKLSSIAGGGVSMMTYDNRVAAS